MQTRNIEATDGKFSELLRMAQALATESLLDRYDRMGYKSDWKHLVEQYNRLRQQTIVLDSEADKVLPEKFPYADGVPLSEIRSALGQIVSYLANKIQPLSLSYNKLARAIIDEVRGGDSLVPLSALLVKLDLSNNWAIGAAALSLQEVMINQKLTQLGSSTDGTLDARFKRLAEEARKRNVQLPELLSGPIYTARSKVLHAGKEPTSGELKIIIDYLNDLQTGLERIR